MSYTGKIFVKEKSWTDKGLRIKPKVEEFPDYTKVKISYSFHPTGPSHQKPFSTQEFLYPGPHDLEGIDITSSGILTATAADGTYTAECQIEIEQSMCEYIGVAGGGFHFEMTYVYCCPPLKYGSFGGNTWCNCFSEKIQVKVC